MSFNFDDGIPIYLQIIEYVKRQIFGRRYLPRQKLPSVRDLSFDLGVNPNTVQKALSELENIGLIYTERTNGKYVTDDECLIERMRRETMHKYIDDFYLSMDRIGIDKSQVLKILNEEER